MKTILVRSAQSTGLDPSFNTVSSIDIDGNVLGRGAFGEVYRALAINNRRTAPQVIKLLVDNGFGTARTGFDTIRELQKRLYREDRALVRGTGRSLVQHYPALEAVPQFSFEGTLDGRPVIGYSASNLVAAGFEDFGKILDDDAKARQFQLLSVSAKLRMSSQLVKAFDFLSTRILFIHADIKADALFVDTRRQGCAIIDFDSGALARDLSDKPTTFGTKQDWLAPEIVKQLNLPENSSNAVKVDVASDMWSINIAIHYFLFGFHPMFFLTEVSDRSMSAYFQQFQWPNVAPSFGFFRHEYTSLYRHYRVFLNTCVPSEVSARLAFTINRGYLDPTARTTYGQWKSVLGLVNRPAIHSFTPDKTVLTDGRIVRLAWDVVGDYRLELTGVGDVTGRKSIGVEIQKDTDFVLTASSDEGVAVSKSVFVRVKKEIPAILAFNASSSVLNDATAVRLTWKVKGAERIEIDGGVGDVTGLSHVDVLPRRDTTFTIIATSPFGLLTRTSLQITVSKTAPAVHRFDSSQTLLIDDTPLELRWKVSADAHKVFIDGIGAVAREGTTRVRQRRDTTYVLRAVSVFGFCATKRIEVRVSKRPPRIVLFVASPSRLREGTETEIRWKVEGASNVRIEPDIGSVPSEGRLKVRPSRDVNMTLVARSFFEVQAVASVPLRLIRPTPLENSRPTKLAVDSPKRMPSRAPVARRSGTGWSHQTSHNP